MVPGEEPAGGEASAPLPQIPSGAGRILAVDHGGRWFGLALSDLGRSLARPLGRVDGESAFLERLAELEAEGELGGILVGLPRNMDGSLGPKAEEVLAFVERLAGRTDLPRETWDERLTTIEADRRLREAGLGARRRGREVDSQAARILLQSWLDARARPSGGGV